ncbi:fumarylacetoacetate hydrolase family protein [Alteromonas sp. P256]|uniref:fumarylacetoacetate hydrolase family protein n=1 Tax=Alteromonas sp. P256 TaxID=3117399 RepID=UPI002FDF1347
MKLFNLHQSNKRFIAIEQADGSVRGLEVATGSIPTIEEFLTLTKAAQASISKRISDGKEINMDTVDFLPAVSAPGKVVCIGLNYHDHTKESGYDQPDYPTIFPRFNSSLTGHNCPIIRPTISDSLDFEGELAVIIGKGGRHISKQDALNHVFGYSIFNDGSVREFQFKSPQWTVGKNFDDTGAFGPSIVTADSLPAGGKSLKLQTRLNNNVVQSANTSDMIFHVDELISILSQAVTLEAGDVIVAGTPSGIGWARDPKILMQEGDVCEVEIEGIGTLSNPIKQESVSKPSLSKTAYRSMR